MQPIEPGDFKHKAAELGLDRAELLAAVQARLDRDFGGRARAISFNHGVLKIITPSAPVASELRLRQAAILAATNVKIDRLQIVIGQFPPG